LKCFVKRFQTCKPRLKLAIDLYFRMTLKKQSRAQDKTTRQINITKVNVNAKTYESTQSCTFDEKQSW